MNQALALILVCASLAATAAAAAESAWSEERPRWIETLEPGSLVRVRNPWGDVHARFGGYEHRVEVLATLQLAPGAAPRPAMAVERPDGGLEVVVGPESGGEAAAPSGTPRSRADLVLFVPQGARLEVQTGAGRIEIKGLRGAVSAASLSGAISIRSVSGRVDAKSERGAISVALENGQTHADQAISTETGDIEVYLWEDARADVHLATSGEITTDFSIEIEHRRLEEPGKRAVATVGDGGPALWLTSKRGRIRLLRLQRGLTPDDPSSGGIR